MCAKHFTLLLLLFDECIRIFSAFLVIVEYSVCFVVWCERVCAKLVLMFSFSRYFFGWILFVCWFVDIASFRISFSFVCHKKLCFSVLAFHFFVSVRFYFFKFNSKFSTFYRTQFFEHLLTIQTECVTSRDRKVYIIPNLFFCFLDDRIVKRK